MPQREKLFWLYTGIFNHTLITSTPGDHWYSTHAPNKNRKLYNYLFLNHDGTLKEEKSKTVYTLEKLNGKGSYNFVKSKHWFHTLLPDFLMGARN